MEIHSNILNPICPLKNKPPLLTKMLKLNKYDCPILDGLPIKKKNQTKLTVHIHLINITVFSAEKKEKDSCRVSYVDIHINQHVTKQRS